MTDQLRNFLIRVLDPNGLNEALWIYAEQAVRRDIHFRGNTEPGGLNPTEHTIPGLVIIGGNELEPLARSIGRVFLKIMTTTELLWLPINAHQQLGNWTIECAPLTDYMRLTSHSDETICRRSGINPKTGQPQEHP